MKAADSLLNQVSAADQSSESLLPLQRSIAPFATAPLDRESPGEAHLALLSRFLHRNSCFLEVAATDCALSLTVAKRVRSVYAVAHAPVIAEPCRLPAHFHLILAERACIPVPQGSVDVAYSDGLIDRLSVEEAIEHFANVQRALAHGGVFVCFAHNRLLTRDVAVAWPNRCIGPPYTFAELRGLLRRAGFRRTAQYVRFAGANVRLRGALASMIESAGRAHPIQLVATK
jgi:hypothetical protein